MHEEQMIGLKALKAINGCDSAIEAFSVDVDGFRLQIRSELSRGLAELGFSADFAILNFYFQRIRNFNLTLRLPFIENPKEEGDEPPIVEIATFEDENIEIVRVGETNVNADGERSEKIFSIFNLRIEMNRGCLEFDFIDVNVKSE
jgi:hypothetical protein